MADTPKKRNEIEVELIEVTPRDHGQFSAKQNKTYWFAYAEIPSLSGIGNRYSTIRLTAMRNEPFPPHWIEGAKVRATVRDIKGRDGEGTIDVA